MANLRCKNCGEEIYSNTVTPNVTWRHVRTLDKQCEIVKYAEPYIKPVLDERAQ